MPCEYPRKLQTDALDAPVTSARFLLVILRLVSSIWLPLDVLCRGEFACELECTEVRSDPVYQLGR
jgi:hypothetical protein